MSKMNIRVHEANAIPDKTLHTVLANLKCLGKPGKAVQNYPVKRRGEIFDEMEKRGWLEPNSMNLTDAGNEEAKKWLSLCQESNESNGFSVWAIKCSDDDTAADQEYYLRDGWSPFLTTAVLGDTIYVKCEGYKTAPEKVEKIVRDWFPDCTIEKITATPEVVSAFSNGFESKQREENTMPQSAPWEPTMKKIRELKKDEFFTLKPIEEPKESQVWVMDGYDRSERVYTAYKFSDVNSWRNFKGDKEVCTGFTF